MFVSATSAFNFKDKYKNKDWAKYEEKGGDKDKDEETHLRRATEDKGEESMCVCFRNFNI